MDYVSKLEANGSTVYVKLSWKPNASDLFKIQIFDGEDSWTGRFSNDFAKKFQETVLEEDEAYASNVLKCLSGAADNYSFEITRVLGEETFASFNWKRNYQGVTIIHGKVPINKDDPPVPKTSLIDTLLEDNKQLQLHIRSLNNDVDILNKDMVKYKEELEKYVNMKSELEESLYGKFLHLLNTKKKRIQLLEDSLMSFENPTSTALSDQLD